MNTLQTCALALIGWGGLSITAGLIVGRVVTIREQKGK